MKWNLITAGIWLVATIFLSLGFVYSHQSCSQKIASLQSMIMSQRRIMAAGSCGQQEQLWAGLLHQVEQDRAVALRKEMRSTP